MHICPRGRLLGTWVKYNQNYFYWCLFLRYSPTDHTRRRILTHDSSNDADLCKDVLLFGICLHGPSFEGSNSQNKFGEWIRVFKPNSQNRKTRILSKLLYRLTKLCTVMTTTKWPSCVVPTHAPQIKDGGRRFRRNLVRWRSSTLLTVSTVKFFKFRKSKKIRHISTALEWFRRNLAW